MVGRLLSSSVVWYAIVASFALSVVVTSFTITPAAIQITPSTSTSTYYRSVSTTKCYGRKRGNLAQNVSSPPATKNKDKEEIDNDSIKQRKKTASSSSSSSSSNEKKGVAISSSLADWAASSSSDKQNPSPPPSVNRVSDDVEEADNDPSSFAPFTSMKTTTSSRQNRSKKVRSQLTATTPTPSSPRRERQAQRQKTDTERQAALSSVVTSIRDLLGEKSLEVPALLALVARIVEGFGTSDGTTVASFFRTKTTYDYTLAWAGSDEAICHVGTGLHKVPLARLQDIFVTVGNIGLKSKSWRMMEVIRILGPFPNVRNTLLGQVTEFQKISGSGGGGIGADLSNDGQQTRIKIRYDSIVDGIGKQLNAGKDGDMRFVDLNVLYANEEVIICVVPPSSDDKKTVDTSADDEKIDALGEGGKNVLLFLKEDELEDKLEMMRVAG